MKRVAQRGPQRARRLGEEASAAERFHDPLVPRPGKESGGRGSGSEEQRLPLLGFELRPQRNLTELSGPIHWPAPHTKFSDQFVAERDTDFLPQFQHCNVENKTNGRTSSFKLVQVAGIINRDEEFH